MTHKNVSRFFLMQPEVQDEHDVGSEGDWLIVDDILVIIGPGIPVVVTRVFPIIDVGKRLKGKIICVVCSHDREHECSVDHESPLDASSCAIGGIEQCCYTSEEQSYDNP